MERVIDADTESVIAEVYDEEWHFALPRCDYLDGRSLTIVSASEVEVSEPGGVVITDGERTAVYVPCEVVKEGESNGTLDLLREYTEAGRFCEANVVTIRNGERVSIYEPVRIMEGGRLHLRS